MTDDELLALARKIEDAVLRRSDDAFPGDQDALCLARLCVRMIERYQSERAEWDAHAGQWKVTLDEQRAEVERLRTDWDNHRRQISGLIVETYELRAEVERLTRERDGLDGATTLMAETNAKLGAALSAAQKRIEELVRALLQIEAREVYDADELQDIARAALAGGTAGDGEQVTQQQRPVGRSTEE